MNKYELFNKGTRYTRINKTAARNAYVNGVTVVLCPVKLSPFTAWNTSHQVNREYREEYCINEMGVKNDFDNLVNSFEYYNCSSFDTGYYCAFYIAST